jgi:ubiquinone/menaquinone biosynthesis C-methylase UbiE
MLVMMQISRVSRNKHTAKVTYDRLSPLYDWLAGASERRFMLQGVQMLAMNPGESVLELGCGTGKALVELCDRVGEAGTVHALDLSRGMLNRSRTRLAGAGLQTRGNLLEGDGAHLPYCTASFNAIFICFTLELFDTPEIPLVLQECRRVLVPKGRLGVVAMLKTEPVGMMVRLYEWFHERLPAYVDCRPIDATQMIQSTGFSIHQHQIRKMWGLPVEVVIARKI